MPVPSVKQSNALLLPPPLSLDSADGATLEPLPVKNGSADDLAVSAIEQKLRERLLQLHHELRRALDESWMKLIDSVEGDLQQAYGGGSDGKLSPWLSSEEKEPGHPGTASRASNPTEYSDKDSGDLDLDIEDDEAELEIRDIEKDLEEPTGTALQKFCRYTRAKLARAERRVLDVGVGVLISLNTVVMMLAHQQMGYDAAREIGEYDPGMDSLSISEDSPTYEASRGLLLAGRLAC
ncbi:Scn10a [Symbiodinium sp. CCMP2592]|nr:Scn10a [Symbiodinium sp. CCMP2592]